MVVVLTRLRPADAITYSSNDTITNNLELVLKKCSESPIVWSCNRSRIKSGSGLERVKGIEPSCVAWEATVLPLNYTRVFILGPA